MENKMENKNEINSDIEYRCEDVKQAENTLALLKNELARIISLLNACKWNLCSVYLNELKRILNDALYIDSQLGVSIYPYSYLANECKNIINKAEECINRINNAEKSANKNAHDQSNESSL